MKTQEFWEQTGIDKAPARVQNAIKRIYASYPAECLPAGICDPMYMMNIIALELGIGDGKGSFNLPKEG